MKETVLDILIHLFESFMTDTEITFNPEDASITTYLNDAGFNSKNILHAMEWLIVLQDKMFVFSSDLANSTIRFYSPDELKRLSATTRYTLHSLERDQIITPAIREIIIDRLMALELDEINTEHLKWVMLFVFSFQKHSPLQVRYLEDVILLEHTDTVVH